MRGRIAVFSDIAGHLESLDSKLCVLGGDVEKLTLPKDLTLVFNGDLVHRGPASVELLQVVGKLKEKYDKQIYVNIGNHEGNYIPENINKFGWAKIEDEGAALLQDWWKNDIMGVGVAVETNFGDTLITHAGLGKDFWAAIGAEEDVRDVVDRLHDCKQGDILWNTGIMLGEYENDVVGPLWCAASSELYMPWNHWGDQGNIVPFSQIHGHSTPYFWGKNVWRFTNQNIVSRTILMPKVRQSYTTIHGKLFISTDPAHDTKPVPDTNWHPLILENARILKAG